MQSLAEEIRTRFPELDLPTFAGARMTCADAVRKLLKDNKQWEVRSAGKSSDVERWYARAWIATASARRSLLVRRHLGTGELALAPRPRSAASSYGAAHR
ncbi:MAG TPA: hypothetical protein VMC03_15610 [Streptosporangiaceae bacterium]|nr:hypothetical protein [Streptosporangiaceae bacterium]